MPADDVVLRSARNAFLVLLLVLVAISAYQFLTIQRLTPEIAVVWVAGAATFYLSKWHYGRGDGGSADAAAQAGDEN
jgi:hypothetical protein